MAVIADFEHYPEWVDSMKSAEVLTSAGGKAEDRPDGARPPAGQGRLRAGLRLAADQRQLEAGRGHAAEGDGRLVRAGSRRAAGTTVTYTLTVDVNMPMIGMFKRKAEKTIIDGALKGLKKRVEG